MIRTVRLLHKLSENPAYQALLQTTLPANAQFNSGHHSTMMGYDFHLSESGPKLIEVNTNAGGIWYAHLCYQPLASRFSERLGNRLLNSFIEEFALFSKNPDARPGCLAILDENPLEQPLYQEMQVFADLFRQAGIEVMITDPEALVVKDHGLYLGNKRIDMIYNRHCDFYLKSAAMENINSAWLKAQVCLSPNPRTYGLLADKRRMILWSQPELLEGLRLSRLELAILARTIPQTRLLKSLSLEEAWRTRKQWVFKPITGYASRGVYVGEKLTTSKFAELNPANTLIQQRIPPSLTWGGENGAFKTDYRLFAYRNRILAVSARLYQGQVTNLRTPNGGFAKIRMV